MELPISDPLSRDLARAIHEGDINGLRQLLDSHPEIAPARIVDEKGVSRTLLHIAADWPGHFPQVAQTIQLLIESGADPDAALQGGNAPETALHGAASSDDVNAIDALLDGGADIEAPGAIFTAGAPMSDAVVFAQWNAARLLLRRGAKTTLTESAALGLMNRVTAFFENSQPPKDQITAALWHACRGGQLTVVRFLVDKGADVNWLGWDHMTPLDAAIQSENNELIAWLRGNGAKAARPT